MDITNRTTGIKIFSRIECIYILIGFLNFIIQIFDTRNCRSFVYVNDIDGSFNGGGFATFIGNSNRQIVTNIHRFIIDVIGNNKRQLPFTCGRILHDFSTEQLNFGSILIRYCRCKRFDLIFILHNKRINYRILLGMFKDVIRSLTLRISIVFAKNNRGFIDVLNLNSYFLFYFMANTTINFNAPYHIPFTVRHHNIERIINTVFMVQRFSIFHDNCIVTHRKRNRFIIDSIFLMIKLAPAPGIGVINPYNTNRIASFERFLRIQDIRCRASRIVLIHILNRRNLRSFVYVDNVDSTNRRIGNCSVIFQTEFQLK